MIAWSLYSLTLSMQKKNSRLGQNERLRTS
nr:MAG TPA: hypothetical protein [Caudoviricetes sp.]